MLILLSLILASVIKAKYLLVETYKDVDDDMLKKDYWEKYFDQGGYTQSRKGQDNLDRQGRDKIGGQGVDKIAEKGGDKPVQKGGDKSFGHGGYTNGGKVTDKYAVLSLLI